VSQTEPVFSEPFARQVIHQLATNIGFRITGTRQESESIQYLVSKLEETKKLLTIDSTIQTFGLFLLKSHFKTFMYRKWVVLIN
jgi:hypothetical protein